MAKRKKSTEDEIKDGNVNESDDNFGLPEIEYEPLKREEEPVRERIETEENTQSSYNETAAENEDTSLDEEAAIEEERRQLYVRKETNDQSLLPKVVGIIIVLLLVAVTAWYFLIYQPKKKEAQELARKEALLRQEADDAKEAKRIADLKRQDDEQRMADSLANLKPAIGTIEALEGGRTGQYYVVVASAIDDDLIMDYAKKLSLKGVSSKIIPPFGKTKFSRIAVSQADSYPEAQSIADGLKSEYGDGAWVVKY